ncbi:MAG: hypothetical protein ACN6O6_08160 [Pseudomonas sp.]|uniref:hypothetical protein n=1 Tax=Pseudomonas sp. TaxID=306 RepID=UPI003D0F83FC
MSPNEHETDTDPELDDPGNEDPGSQLERLGTLSEGVNNRTTHDHEQPPRER